MPSGHATLRDRLGDEFLSFYHRLGKRESFRQASRDSGRVRAAGAVRSGSSHKGCAQQQLLLSVIENIHRFLEAA